MDASWQAASPRVLRWRTNENSTMRREHAGRQPTTLMCAGSDRRSTMRRMVPLTKHAFRITPGSHRNHGDLPCRGGVPAHGEVLAHLPVEKTASRSSLSFQVAISAQRNPVSSRAMAVATVLHELLRSARRRNLPHR